MEKTAQSLNEILTAETVAKYLGVNRDRLLRWHRESGLPAIKVGDALFFHEPSVAQWLKSRERTLTVSATDPE